MKTCVRCNIEKPFDSFYKAKTCIDKHTGSCRNCILELSKEYRKKNLVSIKTRKRNYYLKNKESILEKSKIYCKNNSEKIRERKRQYIERTRDHYNTYFRERIKKDLNFKIARNIRIRMSIMLRGKYKPASAVKDMGCEIEFFKQYIESQFQLGMTWNNYGEWHLDHIKPLCSFDLENKEEFKTACHYTNYRPLWALDNLKKVGQDMKLRKNKEN